MESVFLLLSGVVLAAGVLYWFWSHIQLTQKKVQLLENAVFELRGMLTNREGPGPPPPSPAPASAPAPEGEPVYNDLADDDEVDWDQVASTPLEALNTPAELQPGGAAGVGADLSEGETDQKTDNQFRELFIQHETRDATPPKPVATSGESTSLESMPVKELRRLAEQRGLSGVSDMKKKELLSALRQQIPVAPSAPEVAGAGDDVVAERTLDLEEATVLE